MKAHVKEFLKRGLMAAGGGPGVMAIVYGILGATGAVESLAPGQVCLEILTVMLLAFIVAGMTVVYQIEKLPLGWAITLHGITLYATYILIYLVNGWLQRQLVSVLVFTGVFIVGYAVIWLVIWLSTRKNTAKVNQNLPK